MSETDAAAVLHELTRHGSPTDRSVLVDFRPLDPGNRPAPFKRYRGLTTTPLPTDLGETGAPAVDVLSGRGRTAQPPPLDAAALARLLFFTAGVTRSSSSPVFEEPTYFRTAMSAGNLHPIEVYVVCAGVDGVDDGVHHFAPLEFGLTRLADVPSGASRCTFVLTGIPWRTAWKYGERGFRHLYWDAGTMLANLLAVADASRLDARLWTAFVDEAVAKLVGVDGETEFPLALVTFDGDAPSFPRDRLPLDLDVEPISPGPITFPLITAAQHGGNLRDDGAVAAWRARAVGGRATRQRIDPPATSTGESIEQVILRRGSTRIMRPETAPSPLLRWGMAAAARSVPADFVAPGTTQLEHELAVHGIEGVDAGAYRWRDGDGDLELVRAGQFRSITQQLCLDQPLGGDSAYTAFHAAPLDPVLGTLGARGYRVAQLEAGIASGRLSLAAFALGAGATGLTFFDEPVRRFFATSASCMLVTSVGIPDYRNAPGGGPRAATELARYGDLMQRLSLQLHRSRRA